MRKKTAGRLAAWHGRSRRWLAHSRATLRGYAQILGQARAGPIAFAALISFLYFFV